MPAGLELILGSGTDLKNSPVNGTLTCFDAAGNVVWTYNSAGNGYIMGVSIADIDADGVNEIAVGVNDPEALGLLLDNEGHLVWSFDASGSYVRVAEIGKVRSDSAGKQVFFAGQNGDMFLVDKDGTEIWHKTITSPNYNTIQDGRLFDSDGDGLAEIYFSQDLYVKKYDNTGEEVWSSLISTGDNYSYGLFIAPVEGTNKIAATVRGRGVCLLAMDGTVEWTRPTPYDAYSVMIADVDGNGHTEIVVGYGNHSTESPGEITEAGGIMVLDANGNELARYALDSSVKFVSFGDANNDGASEIIASCDDGNLYLFTFA